MVLLSEHWLTSFVFTLLRTPGGQPLKHSAYGSRAFAVALTMKDIFESILFADITLPKYLGLAMILTILILDGLFVYYREQPPFLGQRELIMAAFVTLAASEALAGVVTLLPLSRIPWPLQAVSICLLVYSGFRICVNIFWYIMIVTCLPCG